MDTIDNFIEICKQKGLNVTYQRIAIYRYLLKSTNHPTAEEVYNAIRKNYPTISLATVYKTLETLSDKGIISKVTHLHNLARFDGNTETHHHLVCTRCKKIIDIFDRELDDVKITPDARNGFESIQTKIQFEGLCKDCQLQN